MCVKVDKQSESIELHEQSLQSICESLEYKFYYDRLFKQMEKQIREDAINDCVEIVKFYRTSFDGIEWAIRDMEQLKSKL